MTIFFSADSHWNHMNIIKYTSRPFTCDWNGLAEMNQTLIDNWNKVVQPNDTVYHLGDFVFPPRMEKEQYVTDLINQLHGEIHLIPGNHDKKPTLDAFQKHQRTIIEPLYLDIKVNGTNLTLCHFAMRVWNKSHFGAGHLYGHSHGALQEDALSLSFDCGVDSQQFTPMSLEAVVEILEEKKKFIRNNLPIKEEFQGGLVQRELLDDNEDDWIKRNE